jgi:glycine hydroxymethyltransferase
MGELTMIIMIAAMTAKRVIGNGPNIPWHISEDFQLFKRFTTGHTVLMGSTTYHSMGKALPSRNNVVLNKDPMELPDAVVYTDYKKGIEKAKSYGTDVFIIGGGSVYAQGMQYADKLYISWVKKDYEGDVFFPKISDEEWEVEKTEEHEEFIFKSYKRKNKTIGEVKNMSVSMKSLKDADPEIYEAVRNETKRQQDGIELIPSENLVSRAVLEAMGSVLTNKYSEGYPGKRYYGGNEFIDISENLAIDRAKKLFNADHANVQPHSGSNANMGAYMAVLESGDTVLGQKLDHGGHLTHGHPVNFSGQQYNFVQYPVGDDGFIDYEIIRKLAAEHKPKLIVAGFSAYSRTLDFEKFKKIADEVGALLMADVAHIAGLITAGLHPQPFPYCDIVTTTTHKTLRGPRAGMILCKEKFAKAIDKAIFPGIQGGPLDHVIAGKAVAFGEALKPEFIEYQQKILDNAKALAKALIANDIKIVSGGTDNHLMLINLNDEKLTGKELENTLDSIGIYANKNTIPNDKGTPFNPCGLRIGTPVLTTRGMGPGEMVVVAEWLAQVIKNSDNEALMAQIKEDVKVLCAKFPVYTGMQQELIVD